MVNIPLTFIPLTMRSWQTSACSAVIVRHSFLIAAPPHYDSAFIFRQHRFNVVKHPDKQVKLQNNLLPLI
jgi:hypothetical protein